MGYPGGRGLLQILFCLWLCDAATRPRYRRTYDAYGRPVYVGECAGESADGKEEVLPALVMTRET